MSVLSLSTLKAIERFQETSFKIYSSLGESVSVDIPLYSLLQRK
jgi:hypothetical protein